jgi:hypothetical protein
MSWFGGIIKGTNNFRGNPKQEGINKETDDLLNQFSLEQRDQLYYRLMSNPKFILHGETGDSDRGSAVRALNAILVEKDNLGKPIPITLSTLIKYISSTTPDMTQNDYQEVYNVFREEIDNERSGRQMPTFLEGGSRKKSHSRKHRKCRNRKSKKRNGSRK